MDVKNPVKQKKNVILKKEEKIAGMMRLSR